MYIQGSPNPSTLERNRPQLDRPAACVIAQQYSSTAFFSLRFNSLKERLAGVSNMLFYFIFMKLLHLELR
jgi:hypothetical protein